MIIEKNSPRYGIIIQARMSSKRLPGKVLMEVGGKSLLGWQIERLQAKSKGLPVIVATSDQSDDDPIDALCSQLAVPCFRGPLKDVVQRFILCAHEYGLTHIIRVGGDDPLIDPDCCLALVKSNEAKPYDFIYASHRDGWPYGCAAELISLVALEKIRAATDEEFYLEHTIPYIFKNEEKFSILRLPAPQKLQRPDLAFTVDYPEDLKLIKEIFSKFKQKTRGFLLSEVIDFLDKNPELKAINSHLHKGFDK